MIYDHSSPGTRVSIPAALARANPGHWFNIMDIILCHYIKPMTQVHTRERHENKNTRFWATMLRLRNMAIRQK